MSRAMARKVVSSLKSLLTDAQHRDDVAQNVVSALKGIRRARTGTESSAARLGRRSI
jgi:hypothetical protein